MLRLRFLAFLLLIPFVSSAQLHKAGGYCAKDAQCTLPLDNPAHFDPFYNSHLCENFNPKQADFGQKYHALRITEFKHYEERADIFKNFDCSTLWLTGEKEQNGIIGTDYTRIRFHISKAERSKEDPAVYIVSGKSNVKGNVCEFKGEIRILSAYFTDDESRYWHVFYSYRFSENTGGPHAGVFQGMGDADVVADKTGKVKPDAENVTASGYNNRNFVGTWTMYGSKKPVKCIWGDYRLPFTFDFDLGEEEMIVNEKYLTNGWQAFQAGKPEQKKWW